MTEKQKNKMYEELVPILTELFSYMNRNEFKEFLSQLEELYESQRRDWR